MKGIDISSYQGNNINFNAVKADGIEAVIVKATESINYTNMYFDSHTQGVINAGLKLGFYHFFRGQGIVEADYFCDTIASYKDKMDIKPVIDVEVPLADINNQVLAFINRVKERLGIDCIIYSGAYFAGENLNDTRLLKYPIWIAHYDVSEPAQKGIWVNGNVAGHQYSSEALINGISGPCDINNFNEEIFIKKVSVINNEYIGGIYEMPGKINMRAKYQENGVTYWSRWYNMDEDSLDLYKNFKALEVHTTLPLRWGVFAKGKWVGLEGSGIIDAEDSTINGFQAYLTDNSQHTYYWMSSPGDEAGYEWWKNNCKRDNVPITSPITQGGTPINALKVRLG